MKTQPRLAIRVAAAALAMSACAIAGTASETPVAYASVVSARHAPGDTRFADLRALSQVKRHVTWGAIEPTQAQPAQRDASRFADLRALARVKRDVAWAVAERAWGG
jgi:hypothetical protein